MTDRPGFELTTLGSIVRLANHPATAPHYVYARVRACTRVYARVRACTRVYARVRACTRVYARVRACTRVYARVRACTRVYARVRACTRVYARVRACTRVYARVRACLQSSIVNTRKRRLPYWVCLWSQLQVNCIVDLTRQAAGVYCAPAGVHQLVSQLVSTVHQI